MIEQRIFENIVLHTLSPTQRRPQTNDDKLLSNIATNKVDVSDYKQVYYYRRQPTKLSPIHSVSINRAFLSALSSKWFSYGPSQKKDFLPFLFPFLLQHKKEMEVGSRYSKQSTPYRLVLDYYLQIGGRVHGRYDVIARSFFRSLILSA